MLHCISSAKAKSARRFCLGWKAAPRAVAGEGTVEGVEGLRASGLWVWEDSVPPPCIPCALVNDTPQRWCHHDKLGVLLPKNPGRKLLRPLLGLDVLLPSTQSFIQCLKNVNVNVRSSDRPCHRVGVLTMLAWVLGQ